MDIIAASRLLLRDERGQGLVEYALIIAMIAIVCIAALRMLGGTSSNKYNSITSSINTVEQ